MCLLENLVCKLNRRIQEVEGVTQTRKLVLEKLGEEGGETEKEAVTERWLAGRQEDVLAMSSQDLKKDRQFRKKMFITLKV